MKNIPNIPEDLHQQQQNEEDLHYPFPTTTQLFNVIIRTALWMKGDKLPLAIKCYDAIRYKLLQINVTNSDQLMLPFNNNRLIIKLKSVHENGFKQQSFQKITEFIEEAKKSSSTYTTPLEEVFGLPTTD